jgi:sugar/nucleoside kinase (ribokinase family)
MSAKDRSGIVAGGNWIVDHQKIIDAWPPQDTLANIVGEAWGNGGAPYNLLKDLANMGAGFPLAAVGLVGDDADGRRILADCARNGIDVSELRTTCAAATSYTDVMTVRDSGRRTFFHNRGANALLSPAMFDFTNCRAKIFHLGYLLLLDSLDEIEAGCPRACDVFRRAREAGMIASLDCVSENGDRFRSVILPVLPEVDILFANDFEAEKLTGGRLRKNDGTIDVAAAENAARALVGAGVRTWAVVHFPEGACAFSASGEIIRRGSVRVPAENVRGTAGAGDAFAAGVLYALHEGRNMACALELGACVAAASLFDASCSDGVRKADECLALAAKYGFR